MQPTDSRQPKKEKAFTLIELLVVIAIVGILAGLAVVSMSGATEAARIAKLKVYSNSIRSSLMGNRVSEWIFEEGAGTSTIDTVGANNGTLANFNFDPTDGWRSGSSCVSGGCLQFDGANDYVDVGNGASLNDLAAVTIEAWVKPAALNVGNYQVIANKGGDYWGTQWGLYYIGSSSFYGQILRNASATFICPALNVWYHIVYTYDGSYGKIYANGELKSTSGLYTGGMPAVNGDFYIGGYSSRYFNGMVDTVRVYNTALVASDIRENYFSGIEKLLASGQITKEDYQQRLKELNLTYAVKE
jgi:prepilin-type N-terminal cleavage/methylation domain-containing protein